MKLHVVRFLPFFRMAIEISQGLGCNWSNTPDLHADANIWIGYMAYAKWLGRRNKRPTKFDAVLFTHHPGGKGRSWRTAASKAHLCLSMCKRHARRLPEDRTALWPIGHDGRFALNRPLRFFCCMNSSIKAQIRKRVDWYTSLKRSVANSEWRISGGMSGDVVVESYDWCDYLIVLSTLEGGPRPVQEALARCKPVIAPDVGFSWEYPVLRYTGLQGARALCQKLADAADASKASIAGQCIVLKSLIERGLHRDHK